MKFVSPTWDELYDASISLAEKLMLDQNYPFDSIIGVSRGGLALTRIMSDLLNVAKVMITRCEYYSDLGETRKKPVITQRIQGVIKGERVVLVDDVADTGDSLGEIRKYLLARKPKSLTLATLYIKPWSKIVPDYYSDKTDAWIVFPWELREAILSLSSKGGKKILKKTGIPEKYVTRILKLS